MKAKKICAMLVCAMFAATVLPTVSAAATILTAVEDEDIYVIMEDYNYTADDLSELLGMSLDEDDTLYISYYSQAEVEVLTHASDTPTKDSNDIVWFDVDLELMSNTTRQIFFSDEAITDANYDEANTALCMNVTVSDSNFIYIVTIPDGVEFTYGDYSFIYDNNNFTVNDEDGDEKGGLTNWTYNSTFKAWGMNYSDDDKSHQIAFYGDDLHATSTAVTGKRVTTKKWWLLPDTTATYTMDTETTTEYNLFTSTDGYVAFNVYEDYSGYSWWGRALGKDTKFKMSADSFKYETTASWKFWDLTGEWTEISTHESEINGIKVGVVEYIYLSEDTGTEDTDEIMKDNFGAITSKGSATTVSGIVNMFKMGTSRTPDAVVSTRSTNFA